MGGGPPCFPQGFTCLVVLWSTIRFSSISSTGLLPSSVCLSRQLRLSIPSLMIVSTTPKSKLFGLGSSHFARRYFGNRFFFLFLRVLRCFSSPGFLLSTYVFSTGYLVITLGGFPHSDILDSTVVCTSSKLFAACHVLLRLLVPRHSPYALCYLTSLSISRLFFSRFLLHCLVFKVLLCCWLILMVGLGGLEPPTSRLSGVRSNHLSYRPISLLKQHFA